jgi:hypothetical protein
MQKFIALCRIMPICELLPNLPIYAKIQRFCQSYAKVIKLFQILAKLYQVFKLFQILPNLSCYVRLC